MIAIGSDHGGFALKRQLLKFFEYEIKGEFKGKIKDFGTYDDVRGLDEPKVAIAVAEAVANGEADAGILICRSGVGMTIAANKVKGVRCALCYNMATAVSAKEHNNANVIALGADFINLEMAVDIIRTWNDSQFLEGIYDERLKIVENYEIERK